jgi:hypothetical protein
MLWGLSDSTTALSAGPSADHRGVFIYGVKDQKTWFASFGEE